MIMALKLLMFEFVVLIYQQENEQSIYTRMISERESIAQKYLSEGDADKRRIEAQTDQQVQELLSNSK